MNDLSELFKAAAEEKRKLKEQEEKSQVGQALKAVQERLKQNNEINELLEVFVEKNANPKEVVKEIVVEKEVVKEVINSDSFQQPKPQEVDASILSIQKKVKFLEQEIGKIAALGPGSGEVNLRWLDDVDRSSIVDGWYLKYNDTTKKFDFGSPSAGGINPTDIRTVYAEVKNADSVTIHKGDPVYLYRATGNKASVIQAANTGDSTSAKTLGLAYADIAPGNTGLIVTKGELVGVDTSMYAEGDTLYLGATAGTLTNVKPSSPNHLVYIGVVERANQGQGIIYVSPQNGYELDEIHNVNINHLVTLADGHTIVWSAADNQWVNRELAFVSYTNPTPAPSNPYKTLLIANNGSATVRLLEGVSPYLTTYDWTFDKSKLTFPDASQQTTAWTGSVAWASVTGKPTFATVATSGDYADLTGKPTLATVATSGSYTDLTNKPTIPSLTGYATETFVNTAITNLVGAAPSALDTLKEIADQLAADESVVSSLTTTVAGKVSLTGSYADPTWITSLAYSKLTGAPSTSLTINGTSVSLGGSATVTAAAGTLTGNTLNSGVLSSSLTSVGLLTSLGVSGLVNLYYSGAGSQGTLKIGGYNSKGGTGYHDFLQVTHEYASATNPNKFFRLNSTGGLEILNSAYTAQILSIADNGLVTIPGIASVTNSSATTNALAISTHGQLFDDGNFHVHSTSGALWLNAVDGSDIIIGTQTASGSSKLQTNNISLDAGYGSRAPIYGVRAWINCGWNGSSMVTRGSGNMSVSRTGVGVYVFTFATAMPDRNYSINCTAQTPVTNSDVAANIAYNVTPTTTGFTINTARYGTGQEDVSELHVQVVR